MTTALHGGNLRRLAERAGVEAHEILDFSANINPLGPPEWLRQVIGARISDLTNYPDPDASALVEAAADHYHAGRDEILVGNGSAELLSYLPRASGASKAVIPVPAYVDYRVAAETAGLKVATLPVCVEDGFAPSISRLEAALSGDEIVILGQPNNPTGTLWPVHDLRALASRWPATTFVVDEAFADFVPGLESLVGARPPNVLVLRSLTKFYAVPGLRIGCAVGSAELVDRVRRFLPPWSVNTLAQAVGEHALRDTSDYGDRTRQLVTEQRTRLMRELETFEGITVYPGTANFLLVRIDSSGLSAVGLADCLLRHRIAIRVCETYDGLDARYFRIAVRTEDENSRFCEALRTCLMAPPRGATVGSQGTRAVPRRPPAIMLQGTTSGAGKSLMAAALCRILLDDGYRVAPFKSQNMSLNSFVTSDGGEMGRAQVVQASACRQEPDVRMNPILLKPSSDTGAQVIVMGKPVGHMKVEQYIQYKPTAFAIAKTAYDELAADHDVMVLEGAGSPAEVNLKHHDIVNMKMAAYANARVVVVGDIDRGGVFASFAGTLDALTEGERALVSGFLVNRFRGRAELLKDALTWTERTTGRPVLGIVPYLSRLNLPEEDSMGLKSGELEDPLPGGDFVEIVVLDLPHLSNFTDFDAFRVEPDVRLRFARSAQDIGEPDALVLPGSKNVMGDLAFMRAQGHDKTIARLAESGNTEIVGICGGLQMLGAQITDPFGLESSLRVAQGLSLLPVSTTLESEKTLTRAVATHLASGIEVQGYEIHHGRTELGTTAACILRSDGHAIGARSASRRIWGTYLHGVFDRDLFRRWFLDRLRERRGLRPLERVVAPYDLEPALQRLADAVRQAVDLPRIYRAMGLS